MHARVLLVWLAVLPVWLGTWGVILVGLDVLSSVIDREGWGPRD
jgi:hypothetical protein